MDIKPIHTAAHYAPALKEVEAQWDTVFAPGDPKGDRYEVLLTLVEAYEAKTFPIADPDPIEAIRIRMEEKGLENKDLLPIFGTRARVSEILHRTRGLSVDHIRELHKRLEIPAEILLKKYKLRTPAPRKAKRSKKAA